jgi:ABC-2 type transport system permease protein
MNAAVAVARAPAARSGRRTARLLALIAGRELRLTWLLFEKEVRELLVSRALWAMVLISAPLVGFSFIQAVRMYAQSSSNALRLPQLVPNLNPLDGIVIPTFGAVYLMNTFLLPFVAIRAIGNEKQTGALKIALQLPIGINRLVAVKLAALAVGWCIALLPTLSALAIWSMLLGGHLYVPELLSVLLGHALYAFVIAGAAFLAAALTESSATAAIVALAFTLGSWILEFAGTNQPGLVRAVAAFSLSPALRGLEHGLVGSPTALTLFVVGLAFVALTVVCLPPGVSRRQKLVRAGAVAGVMAQALLLVIQLPLYVDVSENQRNSFNPADARALRQMTKELRVSVNLATNDSRFTDLDRNVLSKLQRTMPHVTIDQPETSRTSLLGGSSGAGYGQVTYTYGGKQVTSRATTAREVLPLIEALDGRVVTPDPTAAYPGYPLVATADAAAIWFYVLLPAMIVGAWWYNQRPPALPSAVGGPRRARWPALVPYLAPTRRLVVTVGLVFVAVQLVPYGRDHTTILAAPPPSGSAPPCPTTFAPGSGSTMRLGTLRTHVGNMDTRLGQARSALAAGDQAAVRGQYTAFASTYDGVGTELAELYPIRCSRLGAVKAEADAAVLAPRLDPASVGPRLAALQAGLASIAADLDQRIQTQSPDQPVGGAGETTTDAPTTTGAPPWDSDQTRQLATRACGACHSNQPSWPWYSNIAPMSWLIQDDVDAGRRALDFSEWDRPQPRAGLAAASVLRGAMPPAGWALVRPELRLTDAERAALAQGLHNSLGY